MKAALPQGGDLTQSEVLQALTLLAELGGSRWVAAGNTVNEPRIDATSRRGPPVAVFSDELRAEVAACCRNMLPRALAQLARSQAKTLVPGPGGPGVQLSRMGREEMEVEEGLAVLLRGAEEAFLRALDAATTGDADELRRARDEHDRVLQQLSDYFDGRG
jgi:hypothetical protein